MADIKIDVTTLIHEKGTIRVTFNEVEVGAFLLDAFSEQQDGRRIISFNFPQIVCVKRDYSDTPVPYDGLTISLLPQEWDVLIA